MNNNHDEYFKIQKNTSYSRKSIRSAIILIFARTSLVTPISISLKIDHLKVFLKDIDFLFVSLPFPSRSHVCLHNINGSWRHEVVIVRRGLGSELDWSHANTEKQLKEKTSVIETWKKGDVGWEKRRNKAASQMKKRTPGREIHLNRHSLFPCDANRPHLRRPPPCPPCVSSLK